MESIQDFIKRKGKQFKEELTKNKSVVMRDIGRKGKLNFIREKWFFLPASNLSKSKVFIIEKLRKVKPYGKLAYKNSWREGETEYRIGYYIVGKVGRAKNKWVWGQFCPIIPAKDLKEILKQINRMQ